MKSEITGITRANEGMQGISWNILGQTYVPKSCTDHSFSWHATLPPGTFVPPHIHPDQDEYLYMLEGKLDFMLAGADAQATPGDLIRLGMGVPHGIFNKSDQTACAVLGLAEPDAVRSVLGPAQHERTEARGRRGDGRRIQRPFPAAAARGVRKKS
jgi:mannose-6-phosphate isomerase-like protein (cupin superfamily)